MNKLRILLLSASFLAMLSLVAQESNDTTINFNKRIYEIKDNNNEVKIKVYNEPKLGDPTELKQVYEGVFTEQQNIETYSVESIFSIDFPILKRKKKRSMHSHLDGIYLGRLYTTNELQDFDGAGGIKMGTSNEIGFNLASGIVQIVPGYVGIATAFGMEWRNLHVAHNKHFVNNNGAISVEDAPADLSYTKSRLRTYGFTLPIQLELQPTGKNNLFLSGGVMLGANVYTSNKVHYRDAISNKKQKVQEGKDYSINPFSISYTAQIGWDDFGIYAKYTPTTFFKNGQGPDFQTFSVGLIFTH